MAKLDDRGHEILDSRPVEVPLKLRRPLTFEEKIRSVIREEFSARAASQGEETFEEADDFDVGDDFDPTTPYELDFDQETAQGNPFKLFANPPHVAPSSPSPPSPPVEPKPAEPATP